MYRSIRYTVLLLLSVILSSSIGKAQGKTSLPFNDSTWSQPYEPFRIAGNLYYVGTYDLACYLVTTPKGHILINSGLEDSAPMIRKSVESLGFNFTDIRILLTNQAHYDHVAGLAAIKQATGAKMMINEADAQVLADGGKSDFLFGGNATFPPVQADRLLHDGDVVELGGTRIQVLHHPGHTKGSTSFVIDVTDNKVLRKVLLVNIPSILSQTRISGMPTYPNVGKDYLYTLESLKKIQFDIWVAAHASQFQLHDKRKPGDAYNPEAFRDREGFLASINSIERQYRQRQKDEQ